MKKLWQLGLGLAVFLNIFLAAWYIIHGDLNFQTDIARDFLLLGEVEIKKIVLIGPRAGAAGLFHGPLWLYLNFPVYYLSNGNPVATGWFWMLLIIGFYLSSYFVARKLFGKIPAFIYLIFISFYLIPQAREITHPQAGMFVMPLFFYTFFRYINSLKLRYLIFHILISGILIQLEVASGAPFLILSFLYILYMQVKKRKLTHVFAFLLLVIPLSTYIAFDLRHDFFMFKNLIAYIRGNPDEIYVGFFSIFKNRLEYITLMGIPLLYGPPSFNRVISLIILGLFIIDTFQDKKRRELNLFFLYFFFGYFSISLTNRYYLLVQHFIAFIPMVFMFLSSLITSRYGKYLVLLFLFIIVSNENEGIKYILGSADFIGKYDHSWKFLANMSREVFNGPEKEFGYFIYSPDKFAYEGKYALVYGQKQHRQKQAYYFQKKKVTYVISAPPPRDDPYMTGDWWTVNSIKINKEPTKTIKYPNGYKVERYELTKEEIAIPFDQFEDTGIHFR